MSRIISSEEVVAKKLKTNTANDQSRDANKALRNLILKKNVFLNILPNFNNLITEY